MKMKRIAAMILACVLAVGILGSTVASAGEAVESPVAGKKIAYIMLMTPATIFQMWSDNFQSTAEKLGLQADTFFCDDNAETWQDRISQCAASGYDGLMVSHGGQEYAWSFLSKILEQKVESSLAANLLLGGSRENQAVRLGLG